MPRSMNNELKTFIESYRRLFVLTGAGCSVNSGIPDYRDANGDWKRTQPVRFQAFIAEEKTRRRYWARSMIGWRRFGQARPTTPIAPWQGWRPEVNARCCLPKTWTGCIRQPGAGL
jgi:Sir2 family